MASDPLVRLSFDGVCPDCGQRRVDTPDALPTVGDDFDWDLRDYDGFRLFMLQGLAARFVKFISGSHSNIVGLSVYDAAAMLDSAGYKKD